MQSGMVLAVQILIQLRQQKLKRPAINISNSTPIEWETKRVRDAEFNQAATSLTPKLLKISERSQERDVTVDPTTTGKLTNNLLGWLI